MNYEAWRISYQSSEQAARAAYEEMENLWAINAKAKAENEARNKDAARYRWLRERLMAADFDWQDSGDCALVFSWPKECAVSGNCDATIDAAMLVTANVKVTGSAPSGLQDGEEA